MPPEAMAEVKRSTPRRTSLDDERALYRRAVDTYLAGCYRARSRATASEFAQGFGVTGPSLTRIFRRLFEQTPLQYFRVRQLQHAAELLERSSRSMDEIAVRSALGTRATLFRLFVEQFDVTPEEYRREGAHAGKK
jgi:AraC-like DNA-binding protein